MDAGFDAFLRKPMDIAEVLVHECAHQYFYLLAYVGPYDDGSDERLYWSPPLRRNRPLSRILMAYHALANVRLFYAAVRASGMRARPPTARSAGWARGSPDFSRIPPASVPNRRWLSYWSASALSLRSANRGSACRNSARVLPTPVSVPVMKYRFMRST